MKKFIQRLDLLLGEAIRLIESKKEEDEYIYFKNSVYYCDGFCVIQLINGQQIPLNIEQIFYLADEIKAAKRI